MNPLWMFVIAGVGTFGLRVSLVALMGRVQISPELEKGLGMVAPAVLSALVANGLLVEEGSLRTPGSWHVAGLLATAVAWKTRSIAWTLACGMVTLWVTEWVLGTTAT